MHFIMPIIYPNRCDNEAYFNELIDLTNLDKYLEEKNKDNKLTSLKKLISNPLSNTQHAIATFLFAIITLLTIGLYE